MKKRNTLFKTGVWRSWVNMIQRCYNPNNPSYSRYGGAGIRACEFIRASVFNLCALIGHRPADGMSIDRIDNELGYACGQCAECAGKNWPMNIRWATATTQARNQSDLNYIEIDGQKRCLAEWAEVSGLKRSTVSNRFRSGLRGRDLLSPAHKPLTATIDGETKTIAQWAKIAGIDQSSLRDRIKKHGETSIVLTPAQPGNFR